MKKGVWHIAHSFFDSDEIPLAGCISLLSMYAPGYRFTTVSAVALPGCPVSG